MIKDDNMFSLCLQIDQIVPREINYNMYITGKNLYAYVTEYIHKGKAPNKYEKDIINILENILINNIKPNISSYEYVKIGTIYNKKLDKYNKKNNITVWSSPHSFNYKYINVDTPQMGVCDYSPLTEELGFKYKKQVIDDIFLNILEKGVFELLNPEIEILRRNKKIDNNNEM